ncbi:unnamed protein product [Owenia fusiformis]|uniref:phosphatidylinositol-3,4-bisphosphate 4-phosphatase n=1 Tax=Owenia fusiformis TaxID=6347 RepID=A0A8J1TGK5_OWEFU|nr:unnamed protein product [Owenia fusiformis]CAH1776627.1 unnamed protein product [Owenia fusiformis]
MRFNAKEMANLAQQKATKYDKEGLLHIKEKPEGLFKSRKSEVYTERCFRLLGNLLFYFKGKDPNSEPLGCIVLERCAVQLDLEEQLPYSFTIVFESDEKLTNLASNSEEERDSWIEVLHIASYECLQMQLQSLREQIQSKTGRDPLENPLPTMDEDSEMRGVSDEEPMLEICLACENLPCIAANVPPNPFIAVSVITPPQQQWARHGHSEIIEKTCNPAFLTTIAFGTGNMIAPSTRVKLTVYDIKERITSTMAQLGQAVFTIKDLLAAEADRLRLKLQSPDFEESGYVTVTAWQDQSLSHMMNGNEDQPISPMECKTKRRDMLKPVYDNIVTKSYRFPTAGGTQLRVWEYMGESKLTFNIPKQLLSLWIEEESRSMQQLQDLGVLSAEWNSKVKEALELHMNLISVYKKNVRFLAEQNGAPFKPSRLKANKELEFVPTNLHLQRIWAQNAMKETSGCYDITTVGAFTAYSQKYKNGGLKRLLNQQREIFDLNSGESQLDDKMRKYYKIQNNLIRLRDDIHYHCEGVCRAALQRSLSELKKSVSALTEKTQQLLDLLDDPLVKKAVQLYSNAKHGAPGDRRGVVSLSPAIELMNPAFALEQAKLKRRRSYTDVDSIDSPPLSPETPEIENKEQRWPPWSNPDNNKAMQEEPWDMVRLNTEAAMMCVVSSVSHIEESLVDLSNWLEDITPLTVKLKSCVEAMSKRAKSSLTFFALTERSKSQSFVHTLRYRRDIVFSQALTSVVTAFMTKLRSSMTNETFLRQLFKLGVLLEFESLLSCHGDEMAMIEDMMIGVQDLQRVKIKLIQSHKTNEILPRIQGVRDCMPAGPLTNIDRDAIVVEIPVPENMFQLLPIEILHGHLISLVPVFFNIGINEQATLAEKFGDTSLQELLNSDNAKILVNYYEQYTDLIEDPDGNSEEHAHAAFKVSELVEKLKNNVRIKRNKNVEILQIASEICRRLNGVRFTHCKSAKDRTAMAATLEQVQLLQREHDLAPHIFNHALSCMRSEGVRRENSYKNTGSKKYAFNSIQLLSVPKLYRPPNGTFGNTQT